MQRYAIYVLPEAGPFADFTAQWLGWDVARGLIPARMAIEGLPGDAIKLTEGARRYGFHATIKAPFRLQDGCTEGALNATCKELAVSLAPISLEGLSLQALDGFLALIPFGETAGLLRMAEQIVLALEMFRAPLTADEIARRHPERLTQRQRELLANFGYPHVFEQFQFHMTLTGALSTSDLVITRSALAPHLNPLLPQPYVIRDLCLCGESEDGMFRLLHRYPLTG